MTKQSLQEARDRLAQEHFDHREKLFEVNDFSREVIAVESYKLGFNAAIKLMLEREHVLREALQLIVIQRENFPEAAAENSINFAHEALEAVPEIEFGMEGK